MNALHERSLTDLLRQAHRHGLLAEHRTVDQFFYLDCGAQRFIFTREMARVFLMGLLAAHAQDAAAATPARAA